MMVHDKAKVFEIKANLEAEMNTPTLSGGIEGEFGMTKNNLSRSTETSMSFVLGLFVFTDLHAICSHQRDMERRRFYQGSY